MKRYIIAIVIAGLAVAAGLSTLLTVVGVYAPIAVGVSFAVGMVVVFGLLTTEPPPPEPSICQWCRDDTHVHDVNTGACICRSCGCEVTR